MKSAISYKPSTIGFQRSAANCERRTARCVAALLPIIAFSVVSEACNTKAQPADVGSASIELANRFVSVAAPWEPESTNFKPHLPVVRNGRRLDSMVLVASAAAQVSLAGISGSMALEALATPVFNIGDGVQMEVLLSKGGNSSVIYTRIFDAGRKAEDRDWIPLAIPLELGDPAPGWLVIKASAGPQGDLVGDWLALSNLRVVRR